ncbi:MAG: hypothetical protein LJE87_03535 [Deltaproteobacteria bacterium]|jgi:hypothetical protein|nr:hypothetical protein [Deltaproteobacteria bacterium]
MEERVVFLVSILDTRGFTLRTDQVRWVEMPSPTARQTRLTARSTANDIHEYCNQSSQSARPE